MTKIFVRRVSDDKCGLRIYFGDKSDAEEWKEEEREWKQQGFYCGDDSIEEIGDTDNLSELLNKINEEISDE